MIYTWKFDIHSFKQEKSNGSWKPLVKYSYCLIATDGGGSCADPTIFPEGGGGPRVSIIVYVMLFSI